MAEILACYKPEYRVISELIFKGDVLEATFRAGEYPFTTDDPPYASANMVNLCVIQFGITHTGLRVRSGLIPGIRYEDYVVMVNERFECLCTTLNGRYRRPVSTGGSLRVSSNWRSQRTFKERCLGAATVVAEGYFSVEVSAVFPLSE